MSQPSAGKPLKFWLIPLVLVVLVCVGLLLFQMLHRQTGALVRITQDGQVVGEYPLDQPQTLRFENDHGGYNVVVIADGSVRVSEASCPDQICVHRGPTNQTADPIACLPNGLIVEVIGGDGTSQLDGVTS